MPDVSSFEFDCHPRRCAAVVGVRARHAAAARGVLLTCLEDNKDKISEKCRKVIEEK